MSWDQQFHVIAIVVSFYLLHVSMTLLLIGGPDNFIIYTFPPSILIFVVGVMSWLKTWNASV